MGRGAAASTPPQARQKGLADCAGQSFHAAGLLQPSRRRGGMVSTIAALACVFFQPERGDLAGHVFRDHSSGEGFVSNEVQGEATGCKEHVYPSQNEPQ